MINATTNTIILNIIFSASFTLFLNKKEVNSLSRGGISNTAHIKVAVMRTNFVILQKTGVQTGNEI